MARIGMNGTEIEVFVERLKAGEDFDELAAKSGVEPAWFEVNKAGLFALAGIEEPKPAEEQPTKRSRKG